MIINNLDKANEVLAAYIPAVKELLGKDLTLERMEPLMRHLGNPELHQPIAHIAGTSGKTSTSYYLSALLCMVYKKVGLTISPYVLKITERVQINNQPMDDFEFSRKLGDFIELIKDIQPQPTYFELIIAFIFWEFKRQNLDYTVVETGLGGLFDATNVANANTKICVITDIGLDHTKILGNTVEQIAAQKIGIAHAGNEVFTFLPPTEILEVYQQHCDKVGAKLTILDDAVPSEIKIDENLPLFQRRNWLLAYQVFKHIITKAELSMPDDSKIAATQQIFIPGRMEIHKLKNKTVIFDGAHNEQKMDSFLVSLKAKIPDQKANFLIALKSDKDYPKVLDLIMPVADKLIFTIFSNVQEVPITAINPDILATYCRQKDFNNVSVIKEPQKAYAALLKSDNPLLVVTGSFYLVSEIKEKLI